MTIESQSFEQDEITQQVDDSKNHTLESEGNDFSGSDEASALPGKKDKRETPGNSGSLFKNDRKNKEAHPDITGSALVNGVEFYVSGWRKSGAKGDFYSLSFRQKDAVAAASDLI